MVECRAFLIECRALLIDFSTVLAWGGVVNLCLYGALRMAGLCSYDMNLF